MSDEFVIEEMRNRISRIKDTFKSLYGEELPIELLEKELDRKLLEHKQKTLEELTRFCIANNPEHATQLLVMKDIINEKPCPTIETKTRKIGRPPLK